MIEINWRIKKTNWRNALAFAIIDENGNPHCIAVGFVKVVSENQILITDNYMVETRRNIQQNPKVAREHNTYYIQFAPLAKKWQN